MPKPTDKMYVVVRSDLDFGSQLAQALHGRDEFIADHPELNTTWRKSSNTIVVLHAKDEAHLTNLHGKACQWGIPCSVFREPDLGDQTTCLVLGPGTDTRRITDKLPLATI